MGVGRSSRAQGVAVGQKEPTFYGKESKRGKRGVREAPHVAHSVSQPVQGLAFVSITRGKAEERVWRVPWVRGAAAG